MRIKVYKKPMVKINNILRPIRFRLIEGHLLWVRHRQNWGRGFILLLPQDAVVPG